MYVCFYYAILVCLFFVCSGVKIDTKETLPYKAEGRGADIEKQRDREQKNNIQETKESAEKNSEIETPSEREKIETTQIETTIYTEKGEKKREKQQTMRHCA